MPSRLPQALMLAGLLFALPAEAFAQRHGGRSHGGGWQGGGGHGGGWHGGGRQGYQRGYRGGYGSRHGYGGQPYYSHRGYGGYGHYGKYGAYPGYYGYGGYRGHGGYYGYDYGNDAWVAIGAGLLGAVIGAVVAQPREYREVYEEPPQAEPATHQCPDGSIIAVEDQCAEPPPPALPPPPPSGERG